MFIGDQPSNSFGAISGPTWKSLGLAVFLGMMSLDENMINLKAVNFASSSMKIKLAGFGKRFHAGAACIYPYLQTMFEMAQAAKKESNKSIMPIVNGHASI